MNQKMFNYSEEQKAKAAEFQKAAYEMGEPHIKDSGNRREFESGAVRDIAEGKGRCDLLPLDCVAEYFSQFNCPKYTYFYRAEAVSKILYELNEVQFYSTNCPAKNHIMTAIETFIRIAYEDKFGNAFMELSKHYEEGAKKYAERNWQKGIPAHCYIDSCVRHLLKWYDRWDDEPHDRAVLWNLLGLMWTLEHKPELNDLPCNKKEGEFQGWRNGIVKKVKGGDRMIEVERVGEGRDCKYCSRTYGTLGCCSTVSNKWVYSCEEGHREYEKTHKHMTIPEAIGRLESFIDTFNICKEHDNALVAVSISKEDIQAFTMAIKALEQQPCEDAVSRQAVKNIICSGASIDTDADKEYVCELIDKLPSVTPKEKTGHWITCMDKDGTPTLEEYYGQVYECSVCHFKDFKSEFCPNCGARMVSE